VRDKYRLIKNAIIGSIIYDIIVLAVFKFKSVYLGLFLLILGFVNLLFIIKIERFQSYDKDVRNNKSKRYKIVALIIQVANAFSMITIFGFIRTIQ